LEPLGVIDHCAQENFALQTTVHEQDQALIANDAVIAEAAPKVEAFDTFLNSEGHYGLQNAAWAIGAPPTVSSSGSRRTDSCFTRAAARCPKRPSLKLGISVVRAAVGDLGAQSFVTLHGLTYLAKRWQRHTLKPGGAKDLFGKAV
jgi:hypothetical protein